MTSHSGYYSLTSVVFLGISTGKLMCCSRHDSLNSQLICIFIRVMFLKCKGTAFHSIAKKSRSTNIIPVYTVYLQRCV